MIKNNINIKLKQKDKITIILKYLSSAMLYGGIYPLFEEISSEDIDTLKDGLKFKKNINDLLLSKVFRECTVGYIFSLETFMYKPDDNEMIKLIGLPKIDIEIIAKQILDKLESLPEYYEIVFPFNIKENAAKEFTKGNITKLIKITKYSNIDKNALVKKKESLIDKYRIDPQEEKTVSNEDMCLVIKKNTYISKYDSTDIEDSFYIFKALISILVIYKILVKRKNTDFRPFPYSIKVLQNGSELKSFSESYEDSALIESLTFREDTENRDLGFDTGIEPWLLNVDDFISNKLSKLLVRIKQKSIFDKKRKKIMNSLYWYYESKKHTKNSLKTIYLVTAFDSLVSNEKESKEIKIARICCSIAKDIVDENEINEEINKLYDHRNKVIHGELSLHEIDVNEKTKNYYNCVQYFERVLKSSFDKYMSSAIKSN